jgi:hypothetical protein
MIVILSEAKSPRISLAASPRLAMADTQITELAGRHYLISQLLAGGVEVATPVRDHGIDLIAYIDRMETTGQFFACPIQLKANEEARFGLYRKHEKFPNLLMVYAWNVSSSAPELYALTYGEAFKLLQDRGHTDTKSWNELGGWSLKVNETWRNLLSTYRMEPEDWARKILRMSKSQPTTSEVKE